MRYVNEKLADELFGLVELHQGYAFICDGLGNQSRKKIFGVARAALKNSEIVCRKLRRWLKKYGEA